MVSCLLGKGLVTLFSSRRASVAPAPQSEERENCVRAWEGYDGAKEEETNKISGTPAVLEGKDFSKSLLIKGNV